MKKIILTCIFYILIACDQKGENCCENVNIDIGFDFSFHDINNTDLLDPNNTSSIYDFNALKVYDLINGERVNVFNENFDAPRGISLLEPEAGIESYSIRLFFNHTIDNEFNKRILVWNDQLEDEFKAQFTYNENQITLKKVWVNDRLVYDVSTNNVNRLHYTLVK